MEQPFKDQNYQVIFEKLYNRSLFFDSNFIVVVENDEFNSKPLTGVLAYTVPALSDVFGKPFDYFDG